MNRFGKVVAMKHKPDSLRKRNAKGDNKSRKRYVCRFFNTRQTVLDLSLCQVCTLAHAQSGPIKIRCFHRVNAGVQGNEDK